MGTNPPAPTPVPYGGYASLPVPAAEDANGNVVANGFGSLTATISDNTDFYVNYVNAAPNLIYVAARSGGNLPAGQTSNVSVTFTGTDTAGNNLPPVSVSIPFAGPAPADLATQIVPGAYSVNSGPAPLGAPAGASVKII